MKHIWKRLFWGKGEKERNTRPTGYRIPRTVWMSDLKKAADYGSLLAERGRKLKAGTLDFSGVTIVSGS